MVTFVTQQYDLDHSEILQLQLRDNVKARIIDKKQKNKMVKKENGEAEIRSQFAVEEYFSDFKFLIKF